MRAPSGLRHAARSRSRPASGGSVRLRQHGASAVACAGRQERPGRAVRAQPALRAGAARPRSTPATLLEQMLSPDVKVGTSTPKADPSGDYAFEVFAKAEALKAGARAALEAKALQAFRRTGQRAAAARAATSMAGTSPRAAPTSILSYCTAASAAQRENPGQQIVAPARSARGRRRLRAHRHEWRAGSGTSLRFVHTVGRRTAYSGAARLFRAIARAIGRHAETP